MAFLAEMCAESGVEGRIDLKLSNCRDEQQKSKGLHLTLVGLLLLLIIILILPILPLLLLPLPPHPRFISRGLVIGSPIHYLEGKGKKTTDSMLAPRVVVEAGLELVP